MGAFRRDGRGDALHALRRLADKSWLNGQDDEATPVDDGGVRPLLCVQRSGETLFVPTGWAHATLNLEPSIGFSVEVGDAPEVASKGAF